MGLLVLSLYHCRDASSAASRSAISRYLGSSPSRSAALAKVTCGAGASAAGSDLLLLVLLVLVLLQVHMQGRYRALRSLH